MGLQVLIAGCPAEEKPRIENVVRRAFGERAESGPWTVSLVKSAGDWSVTIDGPEPSLKGLTFLTPEIRLQDALVQALTKPQPDRRTPSLPDVPEASRAPETRDRHQCPKCKGSFVVTYRVEPGERMTDAPVACPHCWQITHVRLAWSAAEQEDYRAEGI